MRPAVFWSLLAAVALVVSSVTVGDASANNELHRPDAPLSQSRGWPWRGRLLNGVHAGTSDQVHLVDTHLDKDQFWGTTELVGLLHRAAERIAEDHPDALLTLGELSKDGGGAIVGHRSHESGRDADVGFYLRDEAGDFVRPPRLLSVRRSGISMYEERELVFDDAANWQLFEALITDPRVPVQHVFTARTVRWRLLEHARSIGVSEALYERAQRLMRQPGNGPRAHREHFHVRIYCQPRDREVCRDRGPYWDWVPRSHTPFFDTSEGPWQ